MARGGRLPHDLYRKVRKQWGLIVKLREVDHLVDTEAAHVLKIQPTSAFDRVYRLLKANGEAIAINNDWTGVERGIYGKDRNYLAYPSFLKIIKEFGDPRAESDRVVDEPIITPALTTPAMDAPAPIAAVVDSKESKHQTILGSPERTPSTPAVILANPAPQPAPAETPPPAPKPRKPWGGKNMEVESYNLDELGFKHLF